MVPKLRPQKRRIEVCILVSVLLALGVLELQQGAGIVQSDRQEDDESSFLGNEPVRYDSDFEKHSPATSDVPTGTVTVTRQEALENRKHCI
jgi:hypothetical protein